MADVKADYRDEVHDAMQRIISRAWSDNSYKQELIQDPKAALAELGVHYPEHYEIRFVDDPNAKVGDWSTSGKGQTAVLTVPIPPKPAEGELSASDLAPVAGAGNCCCCSGLCTCTGAVGHETWY